ncbi:MAG: hypothetical protein KatS3mg125_0606 [Lysobacterales bacterium]|jgi:hypothetical protein|nr:MAG: hypothetical protein KatS3mg125_0606 [Xanthomonadales bacterium]
MATRNTELVASGVNVLLGAGIVLVALINLGKFFEGFSTAGEMKGMILTAYLGVWALAVGAIWSGVRGAMAAMADRPTAETAQIGLLQLIAAIALAVAFLAGYAAF